VKKNRAPARAQRDASQEELSQKLAADKRETTLQVLFKVARLLDEEAIARVTQQQGAPRLRRSHTSLLPHLDLQGTRITDLAERLGVSKQAVSQLVDDLEALGVVAREPDPDDARARRVVFTARGQKGLLDGLAVLRALEAELARAIGREHMQALREGLLAVHDHLEQGR
jgi:DNA-binding MarR family transcriptional regulator